VEGAAVSEGHDTFSPSRLAYLDLCLDWQGEGKSDAADYGSHIHALIEHIATDKAIEASREDIAIADRAINWLASLGLYEWQFEKRLPGVVKDTGGTLDAYTYDKKNKAAIIVDWKGSLPLPTSMQGRAYALNLWEYLESQGAAVDNVFVYFYNYMTGETCAAQYFNKDNLKHDIFSLISRHGGQTEERRTANPGCCYCTHRSSCQVAMTETTTALSATPDTALMPIGDLLEFYDKLKAVMKRAEALESAAKERLITAARAGKLPGYCVKSKRGNKIEWANEAEAKTALQRILDDHFAQADLVGLLPPAQVKARLKEAGVSLTKEDEGRLAAVQVQNSYEYLAKDKA
jgi:hypothetical protein